MVESVAETDEVILIAPIAVVAVGWAAAAIAIAIRLYFIDSTCLESCFWNMLATVTSEGPAPYMIQTSVSFWKIQWRPDSDLCRSFIQVLPVVHVGRQGRRTGISDIFHADDLAHHATFRSSQDCWMSQKNTCTRATKFCVLSEKRKLVFSSCHN